jgi:pimeloyl-ACP methyl ester carboxylesterase
MPYADNNGIRIHYHVEGDGPPLVLQHGFTSSLKNWYAYGYVEPLKKDYRLILIDARGHGESDKPHDTAQYDLKLRVKDVLAVLDEVGIDKAHYLGYSMGGRIGFGIAMHAPERVHSLIIGGMHPYDSGGNTSADERVKLLSQGMEAYVASMEAQSGPIDPARRARLLANDPEALIAAISAPRGTSGDVLPKMTMPCLLYVGEADGFYQGARECVKHIPNATFVSFPGLDHGQVSQGSDVVLPHVTEFLRRITQGVGVAD